MSSVEAGPPPAEEKPADKLSDVQRLIADAAGMTDEQYVVIPPAIMPPHHHNSAPHGEVVDEDKGGK